jgi:hypothetical protein
MRPSIFRNGPLQLAWLSCLFFGAGCAEELSAATFTGTVLSVSGDVAKVAIDGDVMPPNGARAEIFFKIAGGDDEISVATGSALKIDLGDMLVKIEDATGTVEKGQLVRFSSAPSSQAASPPAPTPSSTTDASPTTSPSPPGNASIVGMWMGLEPGGEKVSFTFRADDTVSYVRLQGKKKRVLRGKYRTECGAIPCRVEVFNFEINGVAEKGKTLIGLFEIHEFGFHEFSMKFDLSLELQEHPESGFTKGVVTLIRAKTDTPSGNDPH